MKETTKKNIGNILKGEFIIGKSYQKYIPYLLLIVFLGLFSISSSFRYEALQNQSIQLEKQVASLSLTYITNKSSLMKSQKRSEIEKIVAKYGLRTSKTPPKIMINE